VDAPPAPVVLKAPQIRQPVVHVPEPIVLEKPQIVVERVVLEKPAPIVLPPKPHVEVPESEVITIKPRSQPMPAMLVDDVSMEPAVDIDHMWFEPAEEEVLEPSARLWTELDRLEMPLEGEPHDLWWSEKEDLSSWAKNS
jgi:hypothetical protein